MRIKGLVILAVVGLVILGTVAVFTGKQPSNELDNEEYQVYSSILFDQSKKAVTCVIDDTTTKRNVLNDKPQKALKFEKRVLDDVVINDYNRKNAQYYHLQNKFVTNAKSKVILISAAEQRRIFNNENGWEKFRKKYPEVGGCYNVSRVGFNQNKTKAIVCVGWQGDWLMGAGYYYYLEKKKNKWLIIKSAMAWIS